MNKQSEFHNIYYTMGVEELGTMNADIANEMAHPTQE